MKQLIENVKDYIKTWWQEILLYAVYIAGAAISIVWLVCVSRKIKNVSDAITEIAGILKTKKRF